MSTKYILIHIGEHVILSYDLKDILFEAEQIVRQYVTDHMRHDLPLNVSEKHPIHGDVCDRFDVEVYAVSPESQERVQLPFQAWVNTYYAEQMESEREESIRVAKQAALRLFADYLDAATAGTPLPDSIEGCRNRAVELWKKAQ
jgi:hypothetical protein